MYSKSSIIILVLGLSLLSCRKEEVITEEPKLLVKLSVDPNQERLGNFGQPVSVPDTNAAQNPVFNSISAHYLELAPTAYTALGAGEVVYHAPETTRGGDKAIDFSSSIVKAPGELWLEIPLSEINPGTYEWVRLSLSYQNYDIVFHYDNQPYVATLASFLGFNQYIESFQLGDEAVDVNANRRQGYWGINSIAGVQTGEVPEGATTVPNPIAGTSPIPPGSCVVTGSFSAPLVITGNETEDLTLNMSLSINNSFEWVDINGNDQWDVDEGSEEHIVDMGIRGLVPSYY